MHRPSNVDRAGPAGSSGGLLVGFGSYRQCNLIGRVFLTAPSFIYFFFPPFASPNDNINLIPPHYFNQLASVRIIHRAQKVSSLFPHPQYATVVQLRPPSNTLWMTCSSIDPASLAFFLFNSYSFNPPEFAETHCCLGLGESVLSHFSSPRPPFLSRRGGPRVGFLT